MEDRDSNGVLTLKIYSKHYELDELKKWQFGCYFEEEQQTLSINTLPSKKMFYMKLFAASTTSSNRLFLFFYLFFISFFHLSISMSWATKYSISHWMNFKPYVWRSCLWAVIWRQQRQWQRRAIRGDSLSIRAPDNCPLHNIWSQTSIKYGLMV